MLNDKLDKNLQENNRTNQKHKVRRFTISFTTTFLFLLIELIKSGWLKITLHLTSNENFVSDIMEIDKRIK